MRRSTNKNINNFIGNKITSLTRFNWSGIITNNQNYLQAIENYSWEPPSDWLQLPRLLEGDQRFCGLLAIIQGASGNTGPAADSNFIAFACAGNYIVDWGDGSTAAFSSGSLAQRQYNFASIPDSTLTTQGYKQVIIQAYPQAGATLTSVDLNRRYTVAGVTLTASYVNTWLDIRIAGRNISSLTIRGSSPVVSMNMLKRFEYVGPSSITNIGNNFLANCPALEKILGQRFTSNNGNFFRFANNCYSLTFLDLIDTRAAPAGAGNFYSAFDQCFALETFPPLHWKGSRIDYSFRNCASLKNMPMLDTSLANNAELAFVGCSSLKRVPDFDLSNCIFFGQMFASCHSLEEAPNIDTSKGTSFNAMFSTTTSLRSVPLYNTSNGTDFRTMFASSGIETIPPFDVRKGTQFGRFLFLAPNVRKVSGMTFSSAIDLAEFFYQNGNMIEAGPFDFSGVTSGSTAAGSTGPLRDFFFQTGGFQNLQFTGVQKSINISNMVLCAANLNYLFENLANVTGTGATITITNNWGTAQCNRTIATSKGWTVVG